MVCAIRELPVEGYIYTLSAAAPGSAKACHREGKYIEGEKLPIAAGPSMIEWPDASSAELDYWLAHFRRKNRFPIGNETEIALFEGREARRRR